MTHTIVTIRPGQVMALKKYRKGEKVHLPWFAADDVTITLDDPFFAMMYTADGTLHDVAYSRETAELMVLADGYIAVCRHVADQGAFNRLRRTYVDCWEQ